MASFAISIDLGSTWTKGMLVDLDLGCILARRSIATSQNDLSLGFSAIHETLIAEASRHGTASPEIFLSSSAKGGLRIAAIGIVPELTLKAARLAAASAGGKVVASYAYKIKERDIRSLLAAKPDLVLLAGGTNGGDESYALHNAELLAKSSLQAAIIYAGNEAAQDEVLQLLHSAGKRAIATNNILPDLESLEIDGARKAIAELFLERIIEGKGLSKVRELCSAEPQATPASVFNLVTALYKGNSREKTSERGTEFDLQQGFLCLDMGGATTDVFSASQAYSGITEITYRGIPELTIKRTVEGDLGLRVSAEHTLEQGLLLQGKGLEPIEREELQAYVARLTKNPIYLPGTLEEENMDSFLAETCIAEALRRHAGTLQGVYTASGLRWIQRGKDLRQIKILIGTGGRLAQEGSSALIGSALGNKWKASIVGKTVEASQQNLTPNVEGLRYFRDSQYILPLAANLVGKHTELATEIALSSLIEEPIAEKIRERFRGEAS